MHLGSPGSQARRLTEFLARNDCETLYLVGDIFDGWKLQKKFYWTPYHTRVIKAILTKARRGTRVYYLTGNHDEFMRQFVHKQLRLGKVRLANEVVHTTADGRRLLVIHGDRFDVVMTRLPWLARVGDIGYEGMLWGSHKLNRLRRRAGLRDSRLSASIKTRVKAAVQYLSGFDEQVMARCHRDGFKGVVCGHTHHAETRPIRMGIVSYNCGDWVESCTALSEDFSGRLSIIQAPPVLPRASAPTRSGRPVSLKGHETRTASPADSVEHGGVFATADPRGEQPMGQRALHPTAPAAKAKGATRNRIARSEAAKRLE